MDITPSVNLLRSLRGERIDYVMLVGEAIDNAFDAGATAVDIIVDPHNSIIFQDNGIGITRDRIAAIVSLGAHGNMQTTRLGRFGVGITSNAVNAGNIFDVDSISVDGRVRLQVDWRSILKSGCWQIDEPRWLPSLVGKSTGTIVTISDLRTAKPPAGGWLLKIMTDIAERFYPAIAAGQRITLNGQPVPLLAEPKLTDVVERQLELSDGRSAHLRAGILCNLSSKLSRVHVAYKHRVIMPGTPVIGCGEYSGLTKMFARLQLGGPWHLAKFKNDLTDDEERDELEDAVLEVLRPILEKCNTASMTAKVDEMLNLINDLIPQEMQASRPNKKGNQSGGGGKKKSGSKGKVESSDSQPHGPAQSKRPPRNLIMVTFDGIAEQDGVGAFQAGRPCRINLSKDDPYVAMLLTQRDSEAGARSLWALALALYQHGVECEMPQRELQFEPFGRRIAKLLVMQEQPGGIKSA